MLLSEFFSRLKNFKPGQSKTGHIGFDLASEKLNMVQIGFGLQGPQIMAAVSEYHNSDFKSISDQPERLKTLIRSILKKNRFRGRKIVATVPNSLLKLLFINYVCKANEDEAKALVDALQSRVKHALTDYVIDYLPVNPHASAQVNRMALVAMAKQSEVETYLDVLETCGLKPVALEIGPVAIQRLVSVISSEDDSQKVLVINFAADKSYLTVLWNQEILLDRELAFGMEDVLTALTGAFDVPKHTALEILHKYGLSEPAEGPDYEQSLISESIEDDAIGDESVRKVIIDILKPGLRELTNEIRDVLVYVASETRGGAVEQIYLMGSLARIAEVDRLIDKLISIPVTTINPLYGFATHRNCVPIDIGPVAGIAVATGLSLRGWNA